MASVFGISGLRSRLADLRDSLKIRPSSFSGIVNAPSIFRRSRSVGDDRDLSRVIENLVIPRLVATRDAGAPLPDVEDSALANGARCEPVVTNADIVQFAHLAVHNDPQAMLDFVDARLAVGCSVETLYIELLAPAARQLGKNWEDDSQDFVDVTMGLWRIQEILRELSARVPPKTYHNGAARSALFSPVPGDQHSFGPLMVGNCFERAGWAADILIEPTQHDLNVKCAEQFYHLIGLTVTADCTSGALRSLVSTIRSISRNPDICIMLGGRVINDNPDLVAEAGADGTATDAVSAVAIADQLVGIRAHAADRF